MNILIAEDEQHIANSLKMNLAEEGYNAIIANDGEKVLQLTSSIQFDVILLDWRMPKLTGIEVCKKLREEGNNTPIILLTALTDISNKVEALNLGADDYITKPFSFNELFARINAVVRRYSLNSDKLFFEDITIDQISRKVLASKGDIRLTEKEYELLRYLVLNKGTIITKDTLCHKVWHLDFRPDTNIIEATVKNLRRKLEEHTGKKYIKSIYGEGYILISE